mmetsp:Transcript_24585/g.66296  ORF Transcript_24585/g.66296 Transcript_24585/m.66296 type:complete len:217 (-) Transcript_24585:216-866(-)
MQMVDAPATCSEAEPTCACMAITTYSFAPASRSSPRFVSEFTARLATARQPSSCKRRCFGKVPNMRTSAWDASASPSSRWLPSSAARLTIAPQASTCTSTSITCDVMIDTTAAHAPALPRPAQATASSMAASRTAVRPLTTSSCPLYLPMSRSELMSEFVISKPTFSAATSSWGSTAFCLSVVFAASPFGRRWLRLRDSAITPRLRLVERPSIVAR